MRTSCDRMFAAVRFRSWRSPDRAPVGLPSRKQCDREQSPKHPALRMRRLPESNRFARSNFLPTSRSPAKPRPARLQWTSESLARMPTIARGGAARNHPGRRLPLRAAIPEPSQECCALAAESEVSAHSIRLATHSCWKRSSGFVMGSKITRSELACVRACSGTTTRNPVRMRSRIRSRLGLPVCICFVRALSVCGTVFSPARAE